jgi:hypothetical protein
MNQEKLPPKIIDSADVPKSSKGEDLDFVEYANSARNIMNGEAGFDKEPFDHDEAVEDIAEEALSQTIENADEYSGLWIGSEVRIPVPVYDKDGVRRDDKVSFETWTVTSMTTIDGVLMANAVSPTGKEAFIPADSPGKEQGVVTYDIGLFAQHENSVKDGVLDLETPAVTRSEIETLSRELDLLVSDNNVTEEGKVALWRYATAIHDSEIQGALARIPTDLKANNLHTKYRDLYGRINKARNK